MKDVELTVNIEAKFNWLLPAESTEQQALRDQANLLVAEIAHGLNAGMRVMLLDLTETMVKPNAELSGGCKPSACLTEHE